MSSYLFRSALLPGGWHSNVLATVDARGCFNRVVPESEREADAEIIEDPVLPGMVNAHSHAHQRALAGLAERAGPTEDSFWTWRTTMYQFLERIGPDELEEIATQLYVEMLSAGYTSVVEFHYLHHGPNGVRYDRPGELSERLIRAARRAGIGLTLLPVFYARGGFGGEPLSGGQRRFGHDADGFLRLVQTLAGDHSDDPAVQVGIAPHSLRAVLPEEMRAVVEGFSDLQNNGPIHIHVAEQVREVEDCIAARGRRPVRWLLDEMPVDGCWCLIHCTHMDDREVADLASAQAVACICPTTEANLGDGVFPADAYTRAGGRFAIGSDSHISVSLVEELRWLEYAQRLIHRKRTILALGPGGSTGRRLYDGARAGGGQASGRPVGGIAAGNSADFITLDRHAPILAHRAGDALLDSWLFSGNTPLIKRVVAGGRTVVEDGRHPHQEAIAARYGAALGRLTA